MPAKSTPNRSDRAAASFMSMCRKAGHSSFCMLGVFGVAAGATAT